jgi:dUTP pyrophosphatase
VKLKVKKINPEAKLPMYAKVGDAGMDLFVTEEIILLPGQIAGIKSGLAFEVPDGFVGLLWDKSGLSIKHGIKILGGVLDSGYRGEVVIGVINLGKEPYTFEKGHKLTQLLIQPILSVEVEEAETLSDSKRGVGGLGSTGK